jgi:hypothetical protein
MVFSYYNRLNEKQKSIYRKSDGIHAVLLPNTAELHPLTSQLAEALEGGCVSGPNSFAESLLRALLQA